MVEFHVEQILLKKIPIVVAFRGGSHVWRQMLNVREETEHEILWEINNGTTNTWHENWNELGPLYHVLPEDFQVDEELQEVSELREGGAWNEQLMDETFPENIADHIKTNIHYNVHEEQWDRPYWMPTTSSKFIVGSAWSIMRHRAEYKLEHKQMWTKGLPFKMSFFLWRMWRHKLATDDLWRRQGYIVMFR
ncbi:uncharacterized protein [Nicotiana tomentosiformis]|uniref:uncharacterized protein n=1 Tax=Nicotiana tomentosiformis TaxID=4098 RepID=UPI00388C5855